MPKPTCSVDGCEKPVKTRGWCSMHYERWRTGADFYAKGDLRSRVRVHPPCRVEGCERPAYLADHGLCDGHYARRRTTGSIGPATFRDKDGICTSARNGYVKVFRPGHPLAHADGYVYEHRYVWHEAGRTIPPGFHIHHIDHDRANNDLANLMVISNSDHHREHHPPGSMVRNQYGVFPVKVR